MSVSVVIITHNRPELLAEALASACRQTLAPAEIIVVDDGSTEPVSVADVCGQGIPVRLYRLSGLGASAARNKGASEAGGDFVAFLDDDDLWEPEYLESAMGRIAGGRFDMSLTWLDSLVDEARRPGKCVTRELLSSERIFLSNPGVTGSNVIVSKDVFVRLGGFDESLVISEDKDFLIRALQDGVRLEIVESSLVLHRVHGSRRLSDQTYHDESKIFSRHRFLVKHGGIMPVRDRGVLSLRLGLTYLKGRGEGGNIRRGALFFLTGCWFTALSCLGLGSSGGRNRLLQRSNRAD